jgi:hypothetical protein
MMMLVMIVMMIATVMVRWRSHNSSYAAHDATRYATGHSANNRANWTSGTAPFRCASFTAAYNALSPCTQRHRKKCNDASAHNQSGFHSNSPQSSRLTDIPTVIDIRNPAQIAFDEGLTAMRAPRSAKAGMIDDSLRYRRSAALASESTQIGRWFFDRQTVDLGRPRFEGTIGGAHRAKALRSRHCDSRASNACSGL